MSEIKRVGDMLPVSLQLDTIDFIASWVNTGLTHDCLGQIEEVHVHETDLLNTILM